MISRESSTSELGSRIFDIEELIQLTKFSREEIQFIYRDFKQVCSQLQVLFMNSLFKRFFVIKKCPNGVLTEKDLVQIYSHYFLCGDCTVFAKHLFSALVQHIAMSSMSHESFKIKEINFKQFVQILSSVMKGSLDEKIRWMFYFYDMNKDGIITHDVRISLFFFLI